MGQEPELVQYIFSNPLDLVLADGFQNWLDLEPPDHKNTHNQEFPLRLRCCLQAH